MLAICAITRFFIFPVIPETGLASLLGFIGGENLQKSRVWIFQFSPDFEMF